MKEIIAKDEFEVLEDAVAPSFGFWYPNGTFGIACN